MAKLPKKPKILKMPKKPKASASISSWENYDARCIQRKKDNAHRQSEWHKKVTAIKSAAKKKEMLIKKYSH